MPCIRKKRKQKTNKIPEKINLEQVWREKYTLEDFLKCDKTREILEQNWFYEFNRKYEPEIEKIYESERIYCQENTSTLFYYDRCGSFVSHLTTMLFEYIKPRYDLEFFYNNPNLAKPLIEKMKNIKQEQEEEHKRLIKENYQQHQTQENFSKESLKKFNWEKK